MSNLYDPYKPVVLRANNLTIEGFSVSALSTWIGIPELDCLFDCGTAGSMNKGYNNVFLTHSHGDHSNDIHRHHRLRELPAKYYMDARIVPAFRQLENSLSSFFGYSSPINLNIRELYPGFCAQVGYNGRFVQAIPVSHRTVPSLGYIIAEYRKKLLPQYAHLTGSQLKDLKARNIDITRDISIPLVCFLGDHDAETLEQDEIWQAPVIILECTYIDAPEEATRRGHTDISQLAKICEKRWTGQEIVVKHFSQRYTKDQIVSAFKHFPVPVKLLI